MLGPAGGNVAQHEGDTTTGAEALVIGISGVTKDAREPCVCAALGLAHGQRNRVSTRSGGSAGG
jgi:hypothetical protein